MMVYCPKCRVVREVDIFPFDFGEETTCPVCEEMVVTWKKVEK
jgi:hypothetical protein